MQLLWRIVYQIILLNIFVPRIGFAGDSVHVDLKVIVGDLKKWPDISLDVIIKSNEPFPVVVPRSMSFGFADDSSGFLTIELQEKKNETFRTIKHSKDFDYPASVYYDELDSIPRGKFKEYGEGIGLVYRLNRGIYRVRILARIGALNNRLRNKYSNWVYFYYDDSP